jgi:hypothetical protein
LSKVDTTRTEDVCSKMADNLTESDLNDHKDLAWQREDAHNDQAGTVASVLPTAAVLPIIWTPRFIVIFCLLLAIGLSGATLLTTGWLNHYYSAGWLLIAYTVVNLSGWIAVNKWARSPWVRLGSVFGCLWAILMGLTFVLSIFPVKPYNILLLNATVASSSALLACFLCLSIARTSLQRWDRCFFILGPIVCALLIASFFLFAPSNMQSFLLLQEYIVKAELWLSTAMWCLRLSCWRAQPGPTFLLGIAPFMQIMFMQPANNFDANTVFFSQFMLLIVLLGTLRVLQYELRH